MKKYILTLFIIVFSFNVNAFGDGFKLLDSDILHICNDNAKKFFGISAIAKVGNRKPVIKRENGKFIAIIQFFHKNRWVSRKCIGSETSSYDFNVKVRFET